MSILKDFEKATAELRSYKAQVLLEAALKMEFPGIVIYDVIEEGAGIKFKIKNDQYSHEQIETFINSLKQKCTT